MSNISQENSVVKTFNNISSECHIEILDYLIRSRSKHKMLFPSQKHIADKVGCSDRTVRRAVKLFDELGIVKKKKRYNTTSIYTLSPLLFKYAHKLKHKFTSLNWVLTGAFLLSMLPTLSHIQNKQNSHNVLSSISSYVGNKKPISYLTRERETSASIPPKGLKIKTRRERRMNSVTIPPILATITKRLKLTKWGQIRLIPFPDAALNYAYNEYQHARNVQNSFNWFFAKANHYCIQHNLEPDWKLYYDLAQKHNMPKEPDYISKKPTTVLFKVAPYPKVDLQSRFEHQKKKREEKYKNDKAYFQRVSYWQQFKPKFLEEEIS